MRKISGIFVCAALALTGAQAAQAQDNYPTRPVRVVIAFPPGGPTDFVGRLVTDKMSAELGQRVYIENRAGAAGTVGADNVAKADPDGYSLFLTTSGAVTIAPHIQTVPYDPLRDFAPVALVTKVTEVLVVTPKLGIKTVKELIALAKDKPGAVSFASTGIGSPPHLAQELLDVSADVKFLHVPYRGAAPALTDLLGGQVQVMFDNLPSSIGHIDGGRLRALAVTTATRSKILPDVPTVAETVPGYEASAFFGMAVPAGTPRPIIDKLNKAVNEALAAPSVQARLAEIGGTPIAGTPEAFGKIIADETEKWGKVVKATGATAE